MLHVIIPQRASMAEQMPRAVSSVLSYRGPKQVHIVLAINGPGASGCRHSTQIEERASRLGWPVTVVRVEAPGKPGALNAADAAIDAGAGGCPGPRAYLDADIRLSPGFIARLAETLEQETRPRIAVAPAVHQQFFSPVCRSFFRVWRSLPYTRQWCPGNGFYAVSAAGRERWERFPNVHSDDTIVRLLFDPDELVVVPDCYTMLDPPSSALSLIRARARWSRGSRLAHEFMGSAARRGVASRWRGLIGMLASRPALLADLPSCAAVLAGSWLLAHLSSNVGGSGTWEQSR